MTVDSSLNFDALVEGAALTVSAPWSISGAAPTVLAASAKNGAKGVNYSSTGTPGRVQYDYGSNQTSRAVVMAMNFRLPTMATANLYLNTIISLASGGTSQSDWRVNPTGTVSLRNGTSAIATSTATLAANTWYHSEWMVNDTANTQTLRVYVGTATTPLFELTGLYSGVLTRVAAFGPTIAAAGGVLDLDDLTVANDWIVSSGGPVVTSVLLDFDAIADGTTFSASAPWSTNGVAPVVKTAAAKHGARGAQWASTGTAGRVMYDYGANLGVPLVMSSYFRITTMSSANLYLGSVLSLTTGGTSIADWRVNPAGTVSVRNATTAIGTSTATVAANNWYRASWRVDPTTSTQELRIYAAEGTTPLLTISGAYGGAANTRVPTFGPNTAAAGGAVDMDTYRLAPDWPGPFDASVHRYWHRKKSDGTLGLLIPHRKV